MRLIAFLGTGKYAEVGYAMAGRPPLRTRFATEAIAAQLQPEQVVLLLTAEAAKHDNARALAAALQSRSIPVTVAEVPHGASEAELWQVFLAIEQAAGGQEIALDITHGFRSLPLVGLLAASYFHALTETRLRGLYYGAYTEGAEQAPILNLSPMLGLGEWALAVRAWRDYGDARGLRARTRQASAHAWQQAGARPTGLNRLAEGLGAFYDKLRLGRHDLRLEAAKLQEIIPRCTEEVAGFAPPLRPLLEEVVAPLEDLRQPGRAGDFALIRLQRRSGNLLIATLLAREMMVTLWQQKQCLSTREKAENDLYQSAQLWRELADLRNDLAHCGWRPGPRGHVQIERQFDRKLAELEAWAASLPNAAAGPAPV